MTGFGALVVLSLLVSFATLVPAWVADGDDWRPDAPHERRKSRVEVAATASGLRIAWR